LNFNISAQRTKQPTLEEGMNASRLLLSHLGFLSLANRHRFSLVQPFDATAPFNFLSGFKVLDQCLEREVYSVAVVYCAPGQLTEEAFLENSQTYTNLHPDYEDFINSLGWKVKLCDHLGHKGNMNEKIHGEFSPYYSTYDYELMYHVMTSIPNSERQESKKKLLYGDKVLISWVDDIENYSLKTFKYDVSVNIVIHPTKSGLFRIRICKSSSQWNLAVGPLVDEMVVSKNILGTTVRETVIGVCKTLLEDKTKPFIQRKSIIQDFVSNYRIVDTVHQFYGSFYVTS